MPTLVLGVPGTWGSRIPLMTGCAERGYLWAGSDSAVIDPKTRVAHPFSVEVYDPDPRLRSAFEAVSGGRIPEETLEEIDRHTMTIYIVTEEPPSTDLCLALMRFAAVLLELGGLGVKVETSGVAHGASAWHEMLSLELPELVAYLALTIRVADPEERVTYSCGMQHLGLPDAEVPGITPERSSVLDGFLKYLLLEQPALKDGQTFALEAGGPRFRLKQGPCERFPPEELFHNPFGVWHLEPLEQSSTPARARRRG